MVLDNLIYFEYELDLPDYNFIPSGVPVNGAIYIKSQEEVGFTEANFFLQCSFKGKMEPGKIVVKSLPLATNDKFIRDHEYKFDFTLESYNFPSSYSGDHVQIVWSLVLEIIMDDATRSRKRSDFLQDIRLKSLFKSFSGKIKQRCSILVKDISPNYEIIYFSKRVEQNSYLLSVFGFSLIIIVAFLYSQNIFGVLSYIAVFIGLISLIYGLYLYFGIKILGCIELVGKPDTDKKFSLNIKIEKNIDKIKTVSAFYTINEEVIDDRGTRTTTYRAKIYTSQKKIVKQPISKDFKVLLEYPDQDIPVSFKRNNMRIFALAHIEFTFSNGLSYTVKEEFPMKKVKNPQ